MNDDTKAQLNPAAVRAINTYLFSRVSAAVVAIGLLNAISLVTFVPKMAADQVAADSRIKDARDNALVETGALQESRAQTRRLLDTTLASLADVSGRVAALRATDPVQLQAQIDALRQLGPDAKQVILEVQKIQQQLSVRAPNDKDLADVLYQVVTVVCLRHPEDCSTLSMIGPKGQTAHDLISNVAGDRQK